MPCDPSGRESVLEGGGCGENDRGDGEGSTLPARTRARAVGCAGVDGYPERRLWTEFGVPGVGGEGCGCGGGFRGGDVGGDAVVADHGCDVGVPCGGEVGEGAGDEWVGGDVEFGVTFDAGPGRFGGLVVDSVAELEPADDAENQEATATNDTMMPALTPRVPPDPRCRAT